MFDKRCCRIFWGLVLTAVGCLCIWRLSHHNSGSPQPNYQYILSGNYLLLLPGNASLPAYHLDVLPLRDPSTLIDLREFSFLTNPTQLCNSTPFITAIVHTAPGNSYNRHMIRSTWGSLIKVVFMLGETNSTFDQTSIEDEMKEYSDIVQGSFFDSYRNLTYKHVMGLKWATYHCPNAKYLLKTDDDVFVNTPFLQEFLSTNLSPLGARRLLLCDVKGRTLVKRTYRSKWRVSPAEYRGRWYPQYCTGWAVIYSPDVAFTLYSEAQKSPYFWIDDVHVTGTLASKANLTHTPIGKLSLLAETSEELVRSGQSKTDFLFSLTHPKHFRYFWDMVNQPIASS